MWSLKKLTKIFRIEWEPYIKEQERLSKQIGLKPPEKSYERAHGFWTLISITLIREQH